MQERWHHHFNRIRRSPNQRLTCMDMSPERTNDYWPPIFLKKSRSSTSAGQTFLRSMFKETREGSRLFRVPAKYLYKKRKTPQDACNKIGPHLFLFILLESNLFDSAQDLYPEWKVDNSLPPFPWTLSNLVVTIAEINLFLIDLWKNNWLHK